MKVFWVVDPHSKKSIGYYQLGAQGYQPNSVGEIFLKGIDYGDTTI